jgi:cytochrome P450
MGRSGAGAFYPPKIAPAPTPLSFPFNLATILRNNVAAIPADAYRKPLVLAPGPPRMAFLTGTELVKTVLLERAQEFPKGALQVEVLKPVFGNAMISSEGEEWRRQRRAAAPLFRHEEILQYAPIIGEAAEATITAWRAAPDGTVHNVDSDMMRAAFRVISRTMLHGGAEDVLGAIEKGHADYYRGTNWWLVYLLLGLPHWLPRPGGAAMRAHERRLRHAVSELVRARRAEREDADDLLGRMVRVTDPDTGEHMPEPILVDNIVAFLMAGFDTTAFALTWTLYLISQSPEWETRIVEEVQRVAGDEPVGAAHFERLVTVQQVLSESLRLFPTAPIIVRDIVKDTELEGTVVRGRTIGIIPIYAIHRHQAYWEDPDRFDPGRFAASSHAKDRRYHFMPFGVGPRICIGAAFAMMEATIMLATFVRAARFETLPDFDPLPSAQMFLIPKNGMPLRVSMRRRSN